MCNCIKEIEQKVKTEKHAARVYFEHSRSQSSSLSVTLYRRDGAEYKHNRYESVVWNFCPFCGEKLTKPH